MSPRPYRTGRRQAATEQTRARILAAARGLLAAEDGLEAFTVESVARAADVARMTIYYQFRSKVGLLEALFDDLATGGGIAELQAAFTKADPLDGLDALIDAFCGFWASDPAVMRRVRAAARLDPELEAALRSRDDRRRHALRLILGRVSAMHGTPAAVTLDDAVDVLTALTGFETFDELALSRPRPAIEALLRRTARTILGVKTASH